MDTWRKSSRRLLPAAAAVLAFSAIGGIGTPLAAQPLTALAPEVVSEARPSVEEMLARRDRASRLTIGGDFRSARREWARVAKLQRAMGELPIEALRMQAEMHHVLGETTKAAAVLRQLGEEAQASGSVEVSARAFLDAASLYQSTHNRQQARLCMEQVDRLLDSASFDSEHRRSLEQRIIRS